MAENETEKLTVASIKKLIDDAVDAKTSNAKETTTTTETRAPASLSDRRSTIAEQVQDELRKLHEKEEKEKTQKERESTIDTQLAELKEKTAEKAPVERRRVHKFMGWGE